MQFKKTPAENRIKLQSGMYCHLYENQLVINDVVTVEPSDLKVRIDQYSKSWLNVQYLLNIVFTLLLFVIVYFTGLYILLLGVFASLWHIRKLKQQHLPKNKSNCIPVKYIKKAELVKGNLGFNYLQLTIDYKGSLSGKILRLYDSESTFQHAYEVLKRCIPVEVIGKKESISSVSGVEIPLGKNDAYLVNDQGLFLTRNRVFDNDSKDDFVYYRWIAVLFFIFGVVAILIKSTILFSNYYDVVDWLVLLFFFFLISFPIRYMQKARPNFIDIKDIKKVSANKKYVFIYLHSKSWPLGLRVKLGKKHLSEEQIEYLKKLK